MNNKKEFHITNSSINGIQDWIIAALMPQGVQKLWFEVIPKHFIQVSQIQEIREMTDEEVNNLKKLKIIRVQDNPIPTNQNILKDVVIQPTLA